MNKERSISPFVKGLVTGVVAGEVINLVTDKKERDRAVQKALKALDYVGNTFDTRVIPQLPFDAPNLVKEEKEGVPGSFHYLDPKKYVSAAKTTEAAANGIHLFGSQLQQIDLNENRNRILIPNHISHLDHTGIERALVLNGYSEIADRLVFFTGSRIKKDEKMNWMLDALNTIDILQPDDRKSYTQGQIDEIRKGTEEALEYAWDHGFIPVLYPEGSRSDDGVLQEFKKGSVLLMQKADEIITAGITGTNIIWPKYGRIHPRASDITLIIGEVIGTEEYKGRDKLRPLLKKVQHSVASALPLKMQGEFAQAA